MSDKNLFFIVGLPRSRTLWLSLMMTCGDSFCFHELSAEGFSEEYMIRRMRETPQRYVGNSDSGLSFGMFGPPKEWPCVAVHRDKAQVITSLNQCTGRDTSVVINRLELGLHELTDCRDDVLHVNFDSLDDDAVIQSVWSHCHGDALPFPEDHWLRCRRTKAEIHRGLLRP